MATFVGFVLLNEVKFNKKKFLLDFKDDWGIDIKVDEEENEDKDILIGQIEDIIVAVSLMPTPIPKAEAIENAKTNFRWQEAVLVAENHKAHFIISLMDKNDGNLLKDSDIYQKLIATAINQGNCTGVNILGTVLHPDGYREFAKYYHSNNMFPIENLVYFGLYTGEKGEISAYTYGLDFYGKKELEILNSLQSAEDVYYFLVNVATYVLTSNIELKNGETIGFTEEQKISITESEGVALDGITLKLEF